MFYWASTLPVRNVIYSSLLDEQVGSVGGFFGRTFVPRQGRPDTLLTPAGNMCELVESPVDRISAECQNFGLVPRPTKGTPV